MFRFPFQIARKPSHGAAWMLLLGSLILAQAVSVLGASDVSPSIEAIATKVTASQLEVRIKGNSPLPHTIYQLPKPSRIIIDIAEARLQEGVKTDMPKDTGISLATSEIKDAKPVLTRFEFSLPDALQYTSTQDANDIVLTITLNKPAAEPEKVAGAPTQPNKGLVLQNINIVKSNEKTTVTLLSNDKIVDFSHDTIGKQQNSPPRLFIDINNIKGDELLKEQIVGTSLSKIRIAPRGSGLRIVFDSALDSVFPYKIQPITNGIEVLIEEPGQKDQVSSIIQNKKNIEGQLPEVNPLEAKLSPQATEQQMQDAFSFSGYTKERITVDFYKIDLHNVFRLLREVSGVNMVVDESVTGSLTLALNDVPWDFALDIILNLKDLQKEERFNTLVIAPKNKAFNWPKQAENNLSFEADSKVIEQEALSIKQQEGQPLEVVEAKQLLAKAREFEKREDIETAVKLYENALNKWHDNSKLANKIASLYLVQLRQNAKALFYAKKALEIDPGNNSAALNAAIASANMQEKKKALDFFDQSVSGKKPSKEALLSYAIFSEEQQEFAGALKILDRHDSLYGNDLNAMMTAARIYDKMGDSSRATEKYQAILLSGFRIPPDLAKYIQGRVAMKQNM